MKSNTTNHGNNAKENTVMQKFIVEAESPKSGQVASSGGVRAKDGSMVSQYKNPKPYIEPTLPTTSNCLSIKDEFKNQLGNILLDTVYDLWIEFGRPVVSAKLNQLGQQLISYIEQPKTIPVKVDTIIDVDAKEMDSIPAPDNIIQFPNKRAI